jgi:hypothetical protein
MRRVWFLVAGLLLVLWLPVSAQQVVPLDLKPGSLDNPVNVKSRGKTTAALLCVPGVFDPSLVDTATVSLGGAQALRCATEDVNDDLCDDLVCHFPTQDIGIDCTTTTVVAAATLEDGTLVTGTDSVRPVPCKGKGPKP